MNKSTLASLAGVGVAVAAASAQSEPSLARGVVAGALLAALVGLAGVALQLHVARHAPRRVFAASTANFLACMVTVLCGALALRYIPALAQSTDYKSFAISFGCLGFLVLVLGALDVADALGKGAPRSEVAS